MPATAHPHRRAPRVTVELTLTRKPWRLGVDTLVVSTSRARGPDELALAARERFRVAGWQQVDLVDVPRENPMTVPLTWLDADPHPLRRIVVVTADGGDGGSPTRRDLARLVDTVLWTLQGHQHDSARTDGAPARAVATSLVGAGGARLSEKLAAGLFAQLGVPGAAGTWSGS